MFYGIRLYFIAGIMHMLFCATFNKNFIRIHSVAPRHQLSPRDGADRLCLPAFTLLPPSLSVSVVITQLKGESESQLEPNTTV